ncbi:MAG: putative adenine-specific methylase [Prokaryotic dsDNA virus sp.]|nr:MAG: putative adenine-specific methylase [Prokaryotic dsDNA virus sp.]|tara:strand:- start:23571 stop:24068 length:498 start_codon:yes stop_codon:yes gene_type:complete
MASYEKQGESDEWYTPAYIFKALGTRFDLDVACPPEGPRYVPAVRWFTKDQDGLSEDWSGLVWMNPPFGHQNTKRLWLRKFFEHGNGIALLPDRTSAPWWQEFAPLADAVLFVSPKVKFERPDGSIGEQPGTGTTLFAAGAEGAAALLRASSLGQTFHPARRIAA